MSEWRRLGGPGSRRAAAGRRVRWACRTAGWLLLTHAVVAAPAHAQQPASARTADVFRSTQSANLPTATTIRSGLWMFEISHRFLPPVADGSEALWGLDGPVFNRLGLAWAPTSWMMIGLLRSNLDDNLEPNLKLRLAQGSLGPLRLQVGAMGGVGINFGASEGDGVEDNEAQYYGQLMVDLGLGDVALGIVPTGVHNPRIGDVEPVSTFVLGLHGQWFVTRGFSVLGEWVMSVESVDYPYDGVSAGIELDTRGHSFKLIVTNQVRLNPSQNLVGTPFEFRADELRIGFNITRVLSF